MKVLVFGATGTIGQPIAQALARAGHVVYGLTRSEEKARQLAANEVIPVVGDPKTPDAWISLIPKLDVVIDAVGGAEVRIISPALLEVVSKAAQANRPTHTSKLNYIYTSGTWIHGNNHLEIVSDATSITNPVELTSWRVEFEQQIVKNPVLNGIVIRPAMVYGHDGSLFGQAFAAAASGGTVSFPGHAKSRISLIHPTDLADLFVRAAERAPVLGGVTFDAATGTSELLEDILKKIVEVSGAPSYEIKEPSNLFELAMSTSAVLRPHLARALLDWHPRKPGFVDGMQLYYSAYLAAQTDTKFQEVLKGRYYNGKELV